MADGLKNRRYVQVRELIDQIMQALNQSLDMLVKMELSKGSIMFLGGFVGLAIGILLLIVSLAVFPIQRRRMLKKLKSE